MMIDAHSYEPETMRIRQERIEQNRRALARMLKHHGDIPPEPGCSAEARRIRAAMAAQERDAALEAVISRVCAAHGVTEAEIRARRGGPTVLAARRALFLALHSDLKMNLEAIGRAFGRSGQTVANTIRFATTGSSR